MNEFNSSGFSTQETASNVSDAGKILEELKESNVTSKNQLLWAPGAFVGLAMVIFLGISFYRYHRRFQRKRKSAMEYVIMSLDVNRPRIGAPGCFTNLHQLYEQGHIVPFQSAANKPFHNGGARISDIPVSVKLPSRVTQIYPNPTFQSEDAEEEDSKFTVVSADIHRTFEDQKGLTHCSNARAVPAEAELRLSQLCKHCATKALSSTGQGRGSISSHIDSDLGKYTWRRYDPEDDYAMMDAFHGRPQPRERRRPSKDAARNKTGFKGASVQMRLCPLCFAPPTPAAGVIL